LFNAFLTLVEQIIQPVFFTRVHGHGGQNGTNATALMLAATNTSSHWVPDTTSAQSYAGLYGGALIVSGLAGASVVGPLLDKHHCYKTMLKVGLFGAVCTMLGIFLCLRPGSTWIWVDGVAFGLMGVFMVPILPTALEAGVECTYPLPEEYSSGFLMTIGQLFGIAFTCIMPTLIDVEPNWQQADSQFTPFAIFCLASAGLGGVLMFTFDGDYKRLAAEAAREGQPVAAGW